MQYYRHQPATGRLTRLASKVAPDTTTYLGDTLTYDAAGNVALQLTPAGGGYGRQRESRYAADGTLRLAMMGTTGSGHPQSGVSEESRYDALGRRVWVRARRSCTQANSDQIPEYDQPCSTSLVRRTVWDGSQELGEFQAPGDAFGARGEADTTQYVFDPAWSEHDPHRFFGRVAYTHALGVDRPLAVLRLGYGDAVDPVANGPGPHVAFAPFTVVPLWTTRGAAENGSVASGATTACQAAAGGERCAKLAWPDGWYAYDRARYVPQAWYGTLLEDKRDAAGTLYRRARHYDPATGRFTQEDPIGLAGGVNLYGYAGGDPVNRSDPFGLLSTMCEMFGDCGGDMVSGSNRRPLDGLMDGGGGSGAERGNSGEGNDDCPKFPRTPAGLSDIPTNAETVRAGKSGQWWFSYPWITYPATVVGWLQSVWPGGTWDPKNTHENPAHQDWGNANFGATGSVLFPAEVVRWGGGLAQQLFGAPEDLGKGNLFTPPYRENSRDIPWVNAGITWTQNKCK